MRPTWLQPRWQNCDKIVTKGVFSVAWTTKEPSNWPPGAPDRSFFFRDVNVTLMWRKFNLKIITISPPDLSEGSKLSSRYSLSTILRVRLFRNLDENVSQNVQNRVLNRVLNGSFCAHLAHVWTHLSPALLWHFILIACAASSAGPKHSILMDWMKTAPKWSQNGTPKWAKWAFWRPSCLCNVFVTFL